MGLFQLAVFDLSFQILISRLIISVQSANGSLYFVIFILLLQHVHTFFIYPPAIRISKSKSYVIFIAELLLIIFCLVLFRVPLVFKTIELRYKNISLCIVPYMLLYLNLNTVNFVLNIMKTKQSVQNVLGSSAGCIFARQTPSWCADLTLVPVSSLPARLTSVMLSTILCGDTFGVHKILFQTVVCTACAHKSRATRCRGN